jgi:glycosyltransferase involved in cell wall biosynthesis
MIFIAWAERLDNAADMASKFGAPFYPVYIPIFKQNLSIFVPIRYLLQSIKTWQILLSERPDLIDVTNPPIFAVLNVFLYCKIFGARYILCTHPPALYSRKWSWTVPFLRLFARHATVNMLDQEQYKLLFESWKANSLVITKMPRNYSAAEPSRTEEGATYSIAVVNTFAPDEPIEPILSAAKSLPEVHFYIMGHLTLANPAQITNPPKNVTFTDWLSHDQYWDLLKKSRAVMTLTTYPYSLVAGGTDGMSVGKPIILSRQPALTSHFTKGTIFVEHTPQSIIKGIEQLRAEENDLKTQIAELAVEKRKTWEANFQQLLQMVQEDPSPKI